MRSHITHDTSLGLHADDEVAVVVGAVVSLVAAAASIGFLVLPTARFALPSTNCNALLGGGFPAVVSPGDVVETALFLFHTDNTSADRNIVDVE